jgi:hypothetical protein
MRSGTKAKMVVIAGLQLDQRVEHARPTQVDRHCGDRHQIDHHRVGSDSDEAVKTASSPETAPAESTNRPRSRATTATCRPSDPEGSRTMITAGCREGPCSSVIGALGSARRSGAREADGCDHQNASASSRRRWMG